MKRFQWICLLLTQRDLYKKVQAISFFLNTYYLNLQESRNSKDACAWELCV